MSIRRAAALTVGALTLGAAAAPAALAASGTVTGSKTATPADIACNGFADVTVSLVGETGIAGSPQDIELVLDRSGSMGGAPLVALKSAANQLVDKIDEATDGSLDGTIANGSRIGVVSFASSASVDVPLTADAGAVKAAIDALTAGGNTNHEAAISTGQAELAGSLPSNGKNMIIFTDGQTTVGGNGQAEAAAARAAGTTIYAIGLGDVNVAQLNGWATDPDSAHVFIAPSSSDLDAIFNAIGAAIIVPAATNVTVTDTVAPHFSVSNVAASKGSVLQAGNVLTWTIADLQTETVTLSYRVTHDATQPGGVEAVNSSITYSDAEGQSVAFGSPTVNVRGCPENIDVAPNAATNELEPGASHTVTGLVTDAFGDPVDGVTVSFSILSGPNAGGAGSAPTAGGLPASFTYPAAQGPAGLGTDSIQGCFTNGQGALVCETVSKEWVDTTAPEPACSPTNNPSGNNVPPAANPDGFYVLSATDVVDPNPQIWIGDTGSSAVFGPFASGTKVKLVQAPGATPSIKPGTGDIDWKVTLNGDMLVSATDGSGNASAPVTCLVAPPPK